MLVLTAAEMSAVDRRTEEEFEVPLGELMEAAGEAVGAVLPAGVSGGAVGDGAVWEGQQRGRWAGRGALAGAGGWGVGTGSGAGGGGGSEGPWRRRLCMLYGGARVG